MQLYISRDDEQLGPYGEEELQDAVRKGAITTDILAWTDGQESWRPLSELISFSEGQAHPSFPQTITLSPIDKHLIESRADQRNAVQKISTKTWIAIARVTLVLLCGAVIGVVVTALSGTNSTTASPSAGSAPAVETAETRMMRRTIEYWNQMNEVRAEGRAISMPDMSLLGQKKFDEVATQWDSVGPKWSTVASKLRSLPTLDVDPELINVTANLGDWFFEVSDHCQVGFGFVRHAQQFNNNYSSGGAMIEAFLRGMAGDHPMNKFNEGRADQLRLQAHGEKFVEETKTLERRGNEVMSEYTRVRVALTQRYRTEFQ